MPPNIIFITSHDLGRHLSCYGIKTVSTPALDRLAAEGVRFDRAFCVAPQCSPSRASMHTGRYPHCTGVLGLTHGRFGWDLQPDEEHLAETLAKAGYHTAVIGVHHESREAVRCGFDELDVGEWPAASVASRCERFLDQQRPDAPFYLQVGFFEPHRRFDFGGAVPDESRGVSVPPYLRDELPARAELAGFQGAIRQLDSAVAQLLDALDRRQLCDNTLVIFAADHGIPFPRAKCTLYDPGLETALLVRWPARGWSGGRVSQAFISNVDYYPTILEAAGLPRGSRVQGIGFASVLDGFEVSIREEIFGEMTYHQYYDPMRCIRTERYKLICNFATGPAFMNPTQTYRPAATTLVPAAPEFSQHEDIELYDLEVDPNEFQNLAENPEFVGLRRELVRRLRLWMVETNDPLIDGIPACPQHVRVLTALTSE